MKKLRQLTKIHIRKYSLKHHTQEKNVVWRDGHSPKSTWLHVSSVLEQEPFWKILRLYMQPHLLVPHREGGMGQVSEGG